MSTSQKLEQQLNQTKKHLKVKFKAFWRQAIALGEELETGDGLPDSGVATYWTLGFVGKDIIEMVVLIAEIESLKLALQTARSIEKL